MIADGKAFVHNISELLLRKRKPNIFIEEDILISRKLKKLYRSSKISTKLFYVFELYLIV